MGKPSAPFQADRQDNTSVVPLVDFADLSADHPVTAAELHALDRLLGTDIKTLLNP